MARKPDPYLIDDENPELCEADIAEARPASEVLSPAVYAELTKRKPGQRGPGRKPPKVAVTVRLDPAVLEAWKASGPGWQTRVNEALAKAAPRRKSA